MTSKILIDVDEAGKPMFTVTVPNDFQDDVRDKLVKRFFEELQGSSFVGVVIPRGQEDRIRELIPLTMGHMMEWLERRGRETVRTTEYEDKLTEAIDTLRYIFGCSTLPVE